MKTRLRFEADPSLEQIEILVRAPQRDTQVEAIIKRISNPVPETITVFDRLDNIRMILTDDIVSAYVEGKQVHILTESGNYYIKNTIRYLEAQLDPSLFVRISRYEIVNISKVTSFDFTLAGTLRLELSGGMETWASRRSIPAIRKLLKGREE